jgi:hypothetical protein
MSKFRREFSMGNRDEMCDVFDVFELNGKPEAVLCQTDDFKVFVAMPRMGTWAEVPPERMLTGIRVFGARIHRETPKDAARPAMTDIVGQSKVWPRVNGKVVTAVAQVPGWVFVMPKETGQPFSIAYAAWFELADA